MVLYFCDKYTFSNSDMKFEFSLPGVRHEIKLFSPVGNISNFRSFWEFYFSSVKMEARLSSWDTFLGSLNEKSRPVYERWVKQFKNFQEIHQKEVPNSTLETVINNFFDDLHQSGKATSSLWSIYSIIKSYLHITISYKLEDTMPQLVRILKNWAKKEDQKNSKIFTKAEVIKFLAEAPDDETCLVMKVALIIGLQGFLRLSELTEFQFDQIKPAPKEVVADGFQAAIPRKKQKGPKSNSTFLVIDVLFSKILHNYINIFKNEVLSLVKLHNSKFPQFQVCINLKNQFFIFLFNRTKLTEDFSEK